MGRKIECHTLLINKTSCSAMVDQTTDQCLKGFGEIYSTSTREACTCIFSAFQGLVLLFLNYSKLVDKVFI